MIHSTNGMLQSQSLLRLNQHRRGQGSSERGSPDLPGSAPPERGSCLDARSARLDYASFRLNCGGVRDRIPARTQRHQRCCQPIAILIQVPDDCPPRAAYEAIRLRGRAREELSSVNDRSQHHPERLAGPLSDTENFVNECTGWRDADLSVVFTRCTRRARADQRARHDVGIGSWLRPGPLERVRQRSKPQERSTAASRISVS
jgi:hypothetical protein